MPASLYCVYSAFSQFRRELQFASVLALVLILAEWLEPQF